MIKMHLEYQSPNEIYFHHSTSYFESKLPYNRKAEIHQQCEILYLISGKVQYKIDGEIYNVFPGDVILVNICELHSLIISPEEPYERLVLQFSPHLIPQFIDYDPLEAFNNVSQIRHVLPNEFVKKSKFYKIMNAIKKDCRVVDETTDFKIVTKVMELLREINETKAQILKLNCAVSREASSAKNFSKACTEYINKNLTKKLTAQEIADHLHVCESHLHHLFRKEMGISVHLYVLHSKMQLASVMLNAGKKPQEVSDALGYDYYSTFFKNFKTCLGCTPNEYNERKKIHKIATPPETERSFVIFERLRNPTFYNTTRAENDCFQLEFFSIY